jgi:hypothetical protein
MTMGRTFALGMLAVGALAWLGGLPFFGTGCATPRFGPRARGAQPTRPSAQAIALVRIPTPWYAPDCVVRSRFRDAVAEYEAIAALEDKYFILTEDRRFGGIYVWRSRTDAAAYYSEAWRSGVRQRRGAEPDVVLLDVTTDITGPTRIDGELLGQRSLSYPAVATLVLWNPAEGMGPGAVAAAAVDLEGMLRSFVVTSEGALGLVSLWATREHAEAGMSDARVSQLGAPSLRAFFEAPVLMDPDLTARVTRGDRTSVARAVSAGGRLPPIHSAGGRGCGQPLQLKRTARIRSTDSCCESTWHSDGSLRVPRARIGGREALADSLGEREGLRPDTPARNVRA